MGVRQAQVQDKWVTLYPLTSRATYCDHVYPPYVVNVGALPDGNGGTVGGAASVGYKIVKTAI